MLLSQKQVVGGLLRKLFGAHVCRLPRRISARSKHVEVPNDELTTSFPRKSKICKSFLSMTPYLDFKKSILAMFCSIDEKTAAESHFSISKNEALPIGLWPVLQLTRPPLLWNSIWLEPLSALLRDLADTSA